MHKQDADQMRDKPRLPRKSVPALALGDSEMGGSMARK